jgi:hypothetical protein
MGEGKMLLGWDMSRTVAALDLAIDHRGGEDFQRQGAAGIPPRGA